MKAPNPRRAAILNAGEVLASLSHAPRHGLSSRPIDTGYLSVNEAARVLSMNPAVLRRWLQRGKVRAFKLGGSRWRVRLTDLLTEVPPKGERHAAR